MAIRTAQVEWIGDFKAGSGIIKPGSEAFEAHYSYASIFSDEPGSNPMEILGASLAGCFSGALAAYLAKAGYTSKRISTGAEVHLGPIEEGYNVARIHLHITAEVPGIDEASFLKYAELAKSQCPVAQALGAINITLQAELI